MISNHPEIPLDIVQTLGQYLKLKKIGADKYRALCPFRPEHTPSFTIFAKTQRYYCFGCHASGNVNTFLKKMGLQEGRPIPYQPMPEPIRKPLDPKIAKYWHYQLKDYREYFRARGFPDELINKEWWGWSPDYRRYSIPVWEGEPQNSNLLGIRLRASEAEQEAKYIGLENYSYPMLYNRHTIGDTTFIVFGEFDAKSLELMGQHAVSPTAGTNGFEKDWVKLFGSKVWVVPDNTAEEIAPACAIVELFGGKAKLGRWPLDVKDGNEYYLKYKTMDAFFEYQKARIAKRSEWVTSAVNT